MTDRCQLNLRLDGRRDLLESCKEVAAAQGLSLNAWVIKQLELGVSGSTQSPTVSTTRQPLDSVVDTTRQPLDKQEASELPGKFDAGDYDHALTTPEEALAQAKIFGFTPEEALADAHFQIAMLQSNHDELEDRRDAAKREIEKLTERLEKERADREEIEGELFALKQKSATAGKDLPDAADLLNQLKAKRKKSKTDLADIEAILAMIEES
ncbi:hypothetical protein QUA43_30920 [Microcoleus sp. N9_B4]|uniref:hypothetical protein n=1 Tax=Microcoleus sp. N9_B4 TaxID=3055386 RepID=UPI002FCEDC7C